MKGNIDHPLRLFLEIANRGSLSAAAEALSLSQSGLSRQLAALERHVGQPLFVRHGRGVEPTDAGRRLLEAARPAYQAIDDAVMQLRERHGLTAGNLNVATVHTLGHDFVSEIVARFMRQRPDASVSLLERSSPGVAEMVEGGGAEIGFVYDAAVASDLLEITPLFDEEMGFVVHQSSRFASLAAITLDAHTPPLIVFPPSYALRRMLHGRAFDAKVAAEVDSMDAMLKLVSLTNGQCILPMRIPSRLLGKYGLTRIPIAAPVMRRRIVAVTRRERPLSALAALLLAIARELAAAA
ncbi:LysR family transcriptional regulator [Burkholderia gladioli]|uniref:LysR family transcriptional regulator n=1 Tax=Burkholderia gladioli TaxID=28095 RepID=UPI000F80FF0D|nr:LysR family transcriptional regulator [Burkholderia gladioli]MBU9323151.1 LysR family transcriptional regulator [Burkholderia gladioli]MDN7808628.1 LysR family transcriptional regulator [Burkholderia gladioli]